MGFLGIIANGAKAILGVANTPGGDKVFEAAKGIGNWIDEQQFSDQEKSEAKMKLVEQYSAYLAMTADESTERSITRRVMALFIIRVEFLFLVSSALVYRFDEPLSKYLYQVATDSPWGLLTLGVGAFFWGSHLLRGVAK
jgi:hypothetical protein